MRSESSPCLFVCGVGFLLRIRGPDEGSARAGDAVSAGGRYYMGSCVRECYIKYVGGCRVAVLMYWYSCELDLVA